MLEEKYMRVEVSKMMTVELFVKLYLSLGFTKEETLYLVAHQQNIILIFSHSLLVKPIVEYNGDGRAYFSSKNSTKLITLFS